MGVDICLDPNERVPADVVVVLGETSMAESPVTCESVPVDKSASPKPSLSLDGIEAIAPKHRTYAGALNG